MRIFGAQLHDFETPPGGLYRLIWPRRAHFRAQNSPQATSKLPAGSFCLFCSLTNMANTGAFSADIRGFKILKIAVIAPGKVRDILPRLLALLPSLSIFSCVSCVCACACFSRNQANSHGDRHKYAKKSKPRRTRVNLGAAERLSTLLWTQTVDKWTNGGSANELFASR